MVKRIHFDTESCGLIGATILIQYSTDNAETIHLHNIWKKPVIDTLNLINMFCENNLVGFNIAHDIFHISRTFNILSKLPLDKPPELWDFIEADKEAQFFLNPVGVLDLMTYGQQNEFQAIMKQKPIFIRKIPEFLAEPLVAELTKRIKLNPLYFTGMKNGYEWRIKPCAQEGFVDIELPFNPKKGLKDIAKHVLGFADAEHFDVSHLKIPKAQFWDLNNCLQWSNEFNAWLDDFTHNKKQLEYAKNDIVYTHALDKYFGYPEPNDIDSRLGVMVGNLYNKGFDIDSALCKHRAKHLSKLVNKNKEKLDYNSPKKVIAYLKEGEIPIIANEIKSSSKELLEAFAKEDDDLGEKCRFVLRARKVEQKARLYKKLYKAGKMYVMLKTIGTKTSRMSGGSMEGSGESINPQGIQRGTMREAITFINDKEKYCLSGGDADSFEVRIMCKVYGDEALIELMRQGKKFHAIYGSFMFNMTYEEVMANKAIYNKAKSMVFATAYGAEINKLIEVSGLEEEQVRAGLNRFEEQFPGVRKARESIWEQCTALRQPNGIGTAVIWSEPKKYAESFLGFKRYFTVEIEVMRALYDLGCELPESLQSKVKVNRRDRLQSATGAIMSALFGASFGIQGQIQRAWSNHVIQSPGAQIIKQLQYRIFEKYQPKGIKPFECYMLNVHDELQIVHLRKLVNDIVNEIKQFEKDMQNVVPTFAFDFKTDKLNWSESH